jgi:ABC-type nitrate/sulfonate/bicarbonate transport system substrate-binding protein
MPGSAVLAELTNGRVVAGTLQNPYLAQALKSGAVRVLGYHISAIGTHLLQSSWFTTGAFLEKNPASVRAFAQVLDAASIYCNAHQPQTVDLLASYTKIDPTVIASMVRTNFAPSLDPAQIQPLINAAAKYKVITRSFEAREFIARLS